MDGILVCVVNLHPAGIGFYEAGAALLSRLGGTHLGPAKREMYFNRYNWMGFGARKKIRQSAPTKAHEHKRGYDYSPFSTMRTNSHVTIPHP